MPGCLNLFFARSNIAKRFKEKKGDDIDGIEISKTLIKEIGKIK